MENDLGLWFNLSYASFCVLPRVFMEDMPEEWQQKMANLLFEYDEAFPQSNLPVDGCRVQCTKDRKLTKTPEWLINYRHPDKNMINEARK